MKNNPTPISPTAIRRIVSVKEAAMYLGVSERTFYNYSVQYGGTIPLIKMSKRKNAVDIADLDAFIEARKAGAQ